jgi:hypothetical protein
MVANTDAGQKPMCPICGGVISPHDQHGCVLGKDDLHHTDCHQDLHGERSAMDERAARDLQVQRWAQFDRLPSNKHGARRIA